MGATEEWGSGLVEAFYWFPDEDTVLKLGCWSREPPDDLWLSIAETFELFDTGRPNPRVSAKDATPMPTATDAPSQADAAQRSAPSYLRLDDPVGDALHVEGGAVAAPGYLDIIGFEVRVTDGALFARIELAEPIPEVEIDPESGRASVPASYTVLLDTDMEPAADLSIGVRPSWHDSRGSESPALGAVASQGPLPGSDGSLVEDVVEVGDPDAAFVDPATLLVWLPLDESEPPLRVSGAGAMSLGLDFVTDDRWEDRVYADPAPEATGFQRMTSAQLADLGPWPDGMPPMLLSRERSEVSDLMRASLPSQVGGFEVQRSESVTDFRLECEFNPTTEALKVLLWQRGRDCGDLVVSRASVLTDPPTGLSAFRVDGIAPAELVEPYLELHQPVRIEYPQESTEVSGRPVLEVTYERSGDTFYLAEVGEFLYWIELGPELTLDEVLAALPTT